MLDMSPEGKALIQAVRRAYRPSEADHARNFLALRSRLGDAVMLSQPVPPPPPSGFGAQVARLATSRWSLMTLAALGTAALLVGVGRDRAFPPSASPVASVATTAEDEGAAPVAPAAVAPPAPPPKSEEGIDPTKNESESVRPAARQAPSRQVRDGLSDEVAILSRAVVDLNGGHAESALKDLDEHRRRFADGVLVKE